MESLLSRFLTQILLWLDELNSLAVIVQLLALFIAFLLALIGRQMVGRLLARFKAWLVQSRLAPESGLVTELIEAFRTPSGPWLAFLLSAVSLGIFESFDWDARLLRWAVPFVAFWALYILIDGVLRLRLPAEKADRWLSQAVRPLLLGVVVLHALTLLGDLLSLGFRLNENRITLAALLAGGLVFLLFLLLSRGTRQLLSEHLLPGVGLEPSLTQVLVSLATYTIVVIGLITALNVIGIPLTTFTIIAGGLSVGIGFGLQELISNFISGFILLLERSIGPGDVIQVGETIGVVENVGFRSMRILDLDNVELIIPNNKFLTDVVTNYTANDLKVRIHIEVGVTYEANPRQVEEALLEAAAHPLVLPDPAPSVLFTGFGDSSLDFELLVWLQESMQIPKLSSDLRYQIWDALAARDIEIPFPQRDIHIRSVSPGASVPPAVT